MESAALYIRVSTTDQLEFSPDAQKRLLLDFAHKNNYIVSNENIYIDEGISGRKAEKRPAFMKMIADAKIKPKLFDVILVHKFDRFARSREDSIVYKSLLRKECGIKVISITEQLEDDKFSVILESMLEAMAEYYSLNLSDEVKKGMTEKALRGTLHSSPCYGYKIEDGKMIINEEEAKIVRYIFDEYLNNDITFFSISRNLIEMGVRTKQGNKFQTRTITYILQNKTYIGYLHWTPSKVVKRDFNNIDTIIRKGDFEPIIDEDIFNKVQEKYNENKRKLTFKSKPIGIGSHWLSGVLRCSSCGHTLVIVRDKRGLKIFTAFQCSYYMHGSCTISHRIATNIIEKIVLDELKKVIDNSKEIDFDKNVIYTKKSDEIYIYENKLKKIQIKKQRAKDAYINEIDTLEEYKQIKYILENEEKELLNKIACKDIKMNENEIKEQLHTKIKEAYNIISSENSSLEEKQKAIKNIIKSILFDRATNHLEFQYFF